MRLRRGRAALLLVLLGMQGCGGHSPTAPGPSTGQTPAPAPTPAPPPVPAPPAVPVIARFEIAPSAVLGGGGVDATLALVDARTEDLIVQLSSGNEAAAVPRDVTIRAGSTATTLRIPTRVVSQDVDLTITASAAGHTVTAPLRVLAIKLADLSLKPTEIGGSFRVGMTVELNGTVGVDGSSVLVELSSSDSIVSVPATIRVPDRQMTAEADLQTRSVTDPTMVTVTGRAGGESRAATVRVLPVYISFSADAADVPTGGGSRRLAPDGNFTFTGLSRSSFVWIKARGGGNTWDLILKGDKGEPLRPGHYVKEGLNSIVDVVFQISSRACRSPC